jgi:hypothetical protein
MKNISRLLLPFVLIALTQHAGLSQTAAEYQDSARPFGLDIVAPVMEAGSDEASAVFQSNELPILLDFVNTNLGERQALSDIAAVSLDPEALLLHNESSVRVYFLSEGAGYRNTLGFTTQDLATGDTSSQLLIFPDASSQNKYFEDPAAEKRTLRNNGLPLIPGDFVDLGVYDAGTLVDFFLIANGASGGSNFFTSDALTNPDLIQHVVAFAIADSPFLLVGFEDLYGGGDQDYNDIVFAVDIGATNVAYLANPEPAFWMMMAALCLVGVCLNRRQSGEILSSLC